jgi:hypothetical protein
MNQRSRKTRSVVARRIRRSPLRHPLFASIPIPQIEVVRDPVAGSHSDTVAAASRSGLPIVEVDR